MKRMPLLGSFTAILIILITPNSLLANELQHLETILNTDYTVAGVGGMRNLGSGVITVTNISGTVKKAYLYWNGPTNSLDETANASVLVNGAGVTGQNIGFSNDNCWSFSNTQSYRADITSLVRATGNGTYVLSNFFKSGVNVNGASLIVFFDDEDHTNNHDVMLFDGNDSNIASAFDSEGWNAMLSSV